MLFYLTVISGTPDITDSYNIFRMYCVHHMFIVLYIYLLFLQVSNILSCKNSINKKGYGCK